jgi:hypothetical protein
MSKPDALAVALVQFISEQTIAASCEVLAWEAEREREAPLTVVRKACLNNFARVLPVLAITSGRINRAVVREDDRVAALPRYASIHDHVLLALDQDDRETIACLAVYRSVVVSGERPIRWIGKKIKLRSPTAET